MNKNRIPYLEKSSSNPSLPMNRVVTSTSDFVLEEDDPQVIYVAKSIAEQAMGRAWDDFLPLNAHDIDQSDLIDFAKAAISALGSPVVSQPQVEAELVHKSSPGEPVAWRYRWKHSDGWNLSDVKIIGGVAIAAVEPLYAAPQPVACPEQVGITELAEWFYDNGHEFIMSDDEDVAEALLDTFNIVRKPETGSVPSFEKNSEAQG